MNLSIRRFIISNITPTIWKIFPQRKIRTIQKFSYTEKDTGARLLQYLVLMPNSEIKKELFQHVLEELHHSELFGELSKELSDTYINVPIPPREFQITIDSSFDDLLSAYAYAHIGESSINKDFSAYNNKSFDRKIRATFAKVASDETKHAESTNELFLQLCNFNKYKSRKIYFMASMKRRYELYSAFMKQVGEIQLTVILRGIYYLFGGFVFISLRKRLLLSADDQLLILKNQISDFEKSKI